ncbi:winged helix-turn-helix domain-containing protein [Paenibacillus alvei]|uniref:winged helix-turn-helix domain-containing protein n=1 Tax=Paenibacillus alvei TaxID=44250 RepID=UPI0013DA498A|nr:hypothetical protein [Paenibacillus alvei]
MSLRSIKLSENCLVDLDLGVILRCGHPYAISRMEARTLEKLYNHTGSVVSTEQLLFHLWRTTEIEKNCLYVIINRLRLKLETNPKLPQYLITIRKKGYLLRTTK